MFGNPFAIENPMKYALSVAKELARLSMGGEEPDPLTNLRLQKLLYYAQAWSLVVRGSELFPETVEAWRHGPVVPAVYREFGEGFGAAPITPDLPIFAEAAELPGEDREFIAQVWEAYKMHSATQLAYMTHRETPWIKAWGSRPANGSGDDPIPCVDMVEFFSRAAKPEAISAYALKLSNAEAEAAKWLGERPAFDRESFSKGAMRTVRASRV